MFRLYMWPKSLTNICKGFHLCKVERKKKLRDFRPAFFKECFFLYVTGTVPVHFRQRFPLAFFFFFSFFCMVCRHPSRGKGGFPNPFLKTEKICSDLGKNTLIVCIYSLSFSCKMQF